MRSFCGLLRRDRGTLETSGKTLNSRKRIKFCYLVMQDVNHQLFTESVLDEVLLSMDNEDIPAAEEILRSLDMPDLKELHPMSLSGGQKQRVAIASALASGREFIVFDEPTSGLDAGHMQQAADCILSLKNQGRNVMIVTHDPEFISRCCDYAVRIEHGGISEQYTLDRVFIATDYFDASINRISAWVTGVRNVREALLNALLMPHEAIREMQESGAI